MSTLVNGVKVISNKFKNSSGTRYLKALFYEQTLSDKSTVVYTLKDVPHEGFPSLYEAYMAANDPTEYKFAVSSLDGYEHWVCLTECTWFKPYVARWRDELALRVQSQALAQILTIAANPDNTNTYQANKYLLDARISPLGEKKKAGRPSRSQVQAEAHQIASKAQREEEDLKRLGLN